MTNNWRDKAACKGLPCEIFFPVGKPGPKSKGDQSKPEDTAIIVCNSCEVSEFCDVSKTDKDTGVWAGKNDKKVKNSGLPQRIDTRMDK